jgi:HD-GYP domain-containing protein (c-di-GMP phosphodiesterase class II)
MVLFSNFMGLGPNKKPGERKGIEVGNLWMTDSQLLKVKDHGGFGVCLSDRYGQDVQKVYQSLFQAQQDLRENVQQGKALEHEAIRQTLTDMVDRKLVDAVYEYAMASNEDSGVSAYSVDLTLTSMKVGRAMEFSERGIVRLGLAAFFSSAGRYQVPEHLLEEGTEETAEIPEMSAKMIRGMGEGFEWMAEIASQIYERYDGSGYPIGLEGTQVPEFSYVIGLVDQYLVVVQKGPSTNGKLPAHEAVKDLIEVSRGKFPPNVLKAFVDEVSLYPVNTVVALNDKSIGRVVSTGKSQPMRPVIELLYDGMGQKIQEEILVNLAESPMLHIVGVIHEGQIH